MSETGFIAFYVTLIVIIGIIGYYAGGELGVQTDTINAPTLELPSAVTPAELGDGTGTNILEYLITFMMWIGYIVLIIVAGAAFGIELLVYLVGLQGLVSFGLPALWSGAIGTVLLSVLFFVLVKTWKGG